MKHDILQAVKVFNDGGIVIFPTDTAFGIGCRMDNEEAIERLYKIRKRPVTQAASLLVADESMAAEYVRDIPKKVRESLIKPFWPGGLTIVLDSRQEKISELVRGGGSTIGVRMPDHDVLLTVIRQVGVPILGPSANFHGEKTPFSIQDLDPELIKKVDYVLQGSCKQEKASTVIDCTVTPWNILREGSVMLALE
jgi:L-threonylcarbamoyladenylate synthase